jgi:hypothetical protein
MKSTNWSVCRTQRKRERDPGLDLIRDESGKGDCGFERCACNLWAESQWIYFSITTWNRPFAEAFCEKHASRDFGVSDIVLKPAAT